VRSSVSPRTCRSAISDGGGGLGRDAARLFIFVGLCRIGGSLFLLAREGSPKSEIRDKSLGKLRVDSCELQEKWKCEAQNTKSEIRRKSKAPSSNGENGRAPLGVRKWDGLPTRPRCSSLPWGGGRPLSTGTRGRHWVSSPP
jgi:hypothetical protein